MSTKENPHKGGSDAFRGRHSTALSIEPPCDPFAGSLEEQAKRRKEQRKAEAPEKADDPESVASSEVPLDPNGLHMELRAIVNDTRDNRVVAT